MVPLGRLIGEAVEELAMRTSRAVGGILSAFFANAPELVIGFFALQAGLFDLVKAAIAGSIVGNLLFVLGAAMIFGGRWRGTQTFNRAAVIASGSTLFLVAIALVVPALFLVTEPMTPPAPVEAMSLLVSGALLIVYLASLLFSLRTHRHLYLQEIGRYEPRFSVRHNVITLVLATAAVAVLAQLLVSSVHAVIAAWGLSQLFIGVIIIGIMSNAVDLFSAVHVARRGNMGLTLQIAIGAAQQVAMVVAPLLVVGSLALGAPMNLIFDPFELIAIVISVLVVNLIVMDGETNWFEGVQLLAAYAIIGIAFFFHP